MKTLLIAGSLMLGCLGLNLAAQDWYHDREMRFQGEGWHGHLFEHVRTDLEYVQHSTWPTGKEAHRLERTKQELGDLQVKLANHRFDQHELNDVIDSMTKSANDVRLRPRDRDVLTDDLVHLREFRDHHDEWWRH